MTHAVENRDGMKVLVVSDMNRRFDPETGLELPTRHVDAALVHASEISRYYGIPLRDIGRGDNVVEGIWTLVHENVIGQRVPYNTEESVKSNRFIMDWVLVRDAAGAAQVRKEKVVSVPVQAETDDGMYVRLEDLLTYAEAQGWKPGAGRPSIEHQPSSGVLSPEQVAQITAIVASVLAAHNTAAPAPTPQQAQGEEAAAPKKGRVWTDEDRRAAGERLRAARAAKAAAGE